MQYLCATLAVALVTSVVLQFGLGATVANAPILYLLVVTVAALFAGRGVAIWVSFASFLVINWFFVTPRYTLTVQSPTEWITLCMFLFTAVITGQLVALRDALIQSRSEAAALADADRLKTALLSMVSHDFRSPLTAIKASVSTLLSEGKPLDTETHKVLCQTIEQETDRLNLLIGNILDLSRLEAGAWQPKIEATPVSELIGMVLDNFNAELNKRIVVQIDSQLTDIAIDSVQMVQVVKNLVENALKYSPSDSLVEIVAGRDDESTTIAVLDRGSGLSGEDIEHIFERFYRGVGLPESSLPGLGIGLAVCRGLVEANGGTLAAGNRQGGGAVFTISLPLR